MESQERNRRLLEMSKLENLKDFYQEFAEDSKLQDHEEAITKVMTAMVWYTEDFFTFHKESGPLHKDFESDRIYGFRKICESTLTAFHHQLNLPLESLYVQIPDLTVLPKIMTPFLLDFWKESTLEEAQKNVSQCLGRKWDENTISSLVFK
ncbi:Oidioi.mRNA.OKI2018_I69.chr1.g3706.t1.cds [Oikopleura dioica]|uniref:Oidioi.mRNA.OKI2018_I69.chr1.g3706.t1.cds n=1 Tax=Oikopleura dioica TaxID=34765 RepID=A0ABN7SUR9_OIKDI|nr:Oidioi.mRNA.OKI2018_I69.chr1.g3706.t1.cds [Oikopleura dioica]